MLSLQALQGEHKVVNIVEDWNVLEQYAGEKLGFYQINGICGKIEIRVVSGRIGFKKEFEDANDKEFIRIRDFCEKRHFIRICENVRDESFFK
jgi:hypothetical protein